MGIEAVLTVLAFVATMTDTLSPAVHRLLKRKRPARSKRQHHHTTDPKNNDHDLETRLQNVHDQLRQLLIPLNSLHDQLQLQLGRSHSRCTIPASISTNGHLGCPEPLQKELKQCAQQAEDIWRSMTSRSSTMDGKCPSREEFMRQLLSLLEKIWELVERFVSDGDLQQHVMDRMCKEPLLQQLDMDLTEDGYNEKLLEVKVAENDKRKKEVVVKYRKEEGGRSKGHIGAMRGKSVIALGGGGGGEERRKQLRRCGVAYEVEVEVISVGGGGKYAKGIGMGMVVVGGYKKAAMPGSCVGGVGYDSDVGEGDVRCDKCPIVDAASVGKVAAGDKLGMIIDPTNSTLTFELNGAPRRQLQLRGLIHTAAVYPVLALSAPCKLRLLKFGYRYA